MNSQSDGNIHVMPIEGIRHEASGDCWCDPILEYVNPDTGKILYVHRDTTADGLH